MIAATSIDAMAGVPAAILRGDAPIAVAHVVERHHPNIGRLGTIDGETLDIALHLRPGSLQPVIDAADAGREVSRMSQLVGSPDGLSSASTDDRFSFVGALMAQDGAWYVANLRASVDGVHVPNQQLAANRINTETTRATRLDPSLVLVSNSSNGFGFRRGIDEAAFKGPQEFPVRFLGTGYQSSLADTHLGIARKQVPVLRDSIDAVRAELEQVGRVEFGDRPMFAASRAREPLWTALVSTGAEFARLLPDELRAMPADDVLRAEVAVAARRVEDALDVMRTMPQSGIPSDVVDVGALTRSMDRVADAVARIPDAPKVANGLEQLPEFRALLERISSDSWLARAQALRAFDYPHFGRSPAERLRNMGAAMELLDAKQGFHADNVMRLKEWIRALADDAATVRGALPHEHRQLAPLLEQVEEYARRNGAHGRVFNAQGVGGSGEHPDYAEVGRMGSALRAYLAIDEAGRLAREQASAPSSFSW